MVSLKQVFMVLGIINVIVGATNDNEALANTGLGMIGLGLFLE